MKREHNVVVTTGRPQVAFRETISMSAEGEGKFVRQSGGRGQFGHCYIRLEPLVDSEETYEFVDEIVG